MSKELKDKKDTKEIIDSNQMEQLLNDKLFYEDLLNSVKKDFADRQQSRHNYELSWQLNMNFLIGNQYCSIANRGEIEQDAKFFFWQEREVYNHIAQIMETRLAKLNRVRPTLSVRPFSNSDNDINCSKVAIKIINSTYERNNMDSKIANATMWSEVCGTSFYKISWDCNKGNYVGKLNKDIYDGDVCITVCPAFEIYPDSNACEELDDCNSLIHAKAYSVSDVKKIYGVDVAGGDVAVYALGGANGIGGLGYNTTVSSITNEIKPDHVVVIEKYIRPDTLHPNGQLIVVAGDKILEYTELPYLNDEDNKRTFPFIKQVSIQQAGCFWGASVIERIIPIQRSYNAVKNRKHEFLNRIAMGVLTVEDGSVDTDNLEEEGLSPGKVLIYRQGSNAPRMMDTGHVPMDFMQEEERLLNEFVIISGVSELMRNSATPYNVTSGVALRLLIEQDDTRLSCSAEAIRRSIRNVAKHLLRLFKQFAISQRLTKVLNENNEMEIFYYKSSDINSDDVVLETENELNDTPTQRKAFVLELLRTGILHDADGKLNQLAKTKLLDTLGFGNWDNSQDISQEHIKKANQENLQLIEFDLLDIDDHDIHIGEHTKFVISGQADKKGKDLKKNMLNHINMHNECKTRLMVSQAALVNSLSLGDSING